VAGLLARASPLGVHLVADQCFHWIASGYVLPWQRGSHRQNATVTEVIGAAAGRFAADGYDVVVDGIVGPWFLETFRGALGVGSEPLRYVVLRPSRAVAAGRALGRTGRSDLVDPEPVSAMYDAFTDLGPFEAHVIDSSGQDPPSTLRAVQCRLEDGSLLVPGAP
jgi:hypothetical protein